jgi:hypothetical protein
MGTSEHLAKRRGGCKVPEEGVLLTVASISEVMDTTKSFSQKSSSIQLNIPGTSIKTGCNNAKLVVTTAIILRSYINFRSDYGGDINKQTINSVALST